MNFLKSLVGYFLAGVIIVILWGKLVNIFGIVGGWIAGLTLVGPLWYFIHHKNFVFHKNDGIFIDMGLAIAITTMTVSILKIKSNFWISLSHSIPTLVFLALGAVLGVVFSIFFENKIIYPYEKRRKNEHSSNN